MERNAFPLTQLHKDDIHPTQLFTFLDRDASGTINFDEFLRALANEMNAKRLALVKMAYQKLDSSGDGVVTTQDIKNVYDVSQNPEVISGKITPEQVGTCWVLRWTVVREFSLCFDGYRSCPAAIFPTLVARKSFARPSPSS